MKKESLDKKYSETNEQREIHVGGSSQNSFSAIDSTEMDKEDVPLSRRNSFLVASAISIGSLASSKAVHLKKERRKAAKMTMT